MGQELCAKTNVKNLFVLMLTSVYFGALTISFQECLPTYRECWFNRDCASRNFSASKHGCKLAFGGLENKFCEYSMTPVSSRFIPQAKTEKGYATNLW